MQRQFPKKTGGDNLWFCNKVVGDGIYDPLDYINKLSFHIKG